ncbi:hypothetical protein EVAR_70649_1 [Eumeta japonica]|uniref:Uncharacterized protein n=1 Tax=Eumeta variegata TaxID=151549 RepID=A0A4C1SAK3_EUMVA|nr:hypothetical protein EVAR_70649_1 [Eumeta japonica]
MPNVVPAHTTAPANFVSTSLLPSTQSILSTSEQPASSLPQALVPTASALSTHAAKLLQDNLIAPQPPAFVPANLGPQTPTVAYSQHLQVPLPPPPPPSFSNTVAFINTTYFVYTS